MGASASPRRLDKDSWPRAASVKEASKGRAACFVELNVGEWFLILFVTLAGVGGASLAWRFLVWLRESAS